MILSCSSEAAERTRAHLVSPGGNDVYRSTFLGPDTPTAPKESLPVPGTYGAMAFLIEQQPNSISKTHFHVVDQFQVVVGGKATLGTHDVSGIAIHFTGAYSPYGPINASDQGVDYFTLRNGFDTGAQYMPDKREKLRAERVRPYREVMVDPDPAWSAERLATLTDAETAEIIPLEADGLAAWRDRLPAGARLPTRDPKASLGQNWLVLGGSLVQEQEATLGRHACLFVHADDAPLYGIAGPGGLEILCMQYPRH